MAAVPTTPPEAPEGWVCGLEQVESEANHRGALPMSERQRRAACRSARMRTGAPQGSPPLESPGLLVFLVYQPNGG